MRRPLLAVSAFLLAAAVGLAAAGAHLLPAGPEIGPDAGRRAADLWDTASLWHTVSALGLFAVAATWDRLEARWRLAGCALLLGGVVGFSGSLYLQALAGTAPLAVAGPVGGSAMILGWIAVAIAGLRGPR